MANKPKLNYAAKPEEAQGKDMFLTPKGIIRGLVPFIPKHIKYIWDFSAGTGKFGDVLREYGYTVFETDIRETERVSYHNFVLDPLPKWVSDYGDQLALVTNPAYSIKKVCYEICLDLGLPFSLLIPADMNQWILTGFRNYNMTAIVPFSRVNFVTPTGKQGKESAAQFHSWFFTRWFTNKNQIEVIDYTKEMKEEI